MVYSFKIIRIVIRIVRRGGGGVGEFVCKMSANIRSVGDTALGKS